MVQPLLPESIMSAACRILLVDGDPDDWAEVEHALDEEILLEQPPVWTTPPS